MKFGWTLHEVVSAPVIIVGQVERIDGFREGANIGFYRVHVEESLKGKLEESTIYLVEPPTATGRFEPPALFPAKYLLVVSPLSNEEAAQEVNQIVGTNRQLGIYSVYANWSWHRLAPHQGIGPRHNWPSRATQWARNARKCLTGQEYSTGSRAKPEECRRQAAGTVLPSLSRPREFGLTSGKEGRSCDGTQRSSLDLLGFFPGNG